MADCAANVNKATNLNCKLFSFSYLLLPLLKPLLSCTVAEILLANLQSCKSGNAESRLTEISLKLVSISNLYVSACVYKRKFH